MITNDYPPVVSGISTVFYQVWARLESESHPVLTQAVTGCAGFDRGKPVRITRHPAFAHAHPVFKLFNSLVQFLYVLYFILFNKVKKLHAGQIWISGTIGLICKKLLGIPYILWVYGGETTPVYMSNKYTAYWAKVILDNAEKLVTNSKYCQKEFLDYGFPAERCPIVLPGTDPQFFTPGEPPAQLMKKWNPAGKKVFLTVARVSERKGHDLVIKSLPEILNNHSDLLYLIVGNGPDRERLENLAGELGVSDTVKFCGFVPDADLPDYYRMCDVYTMPNREVFDSTDSIEGFGISFVEASACGKPVIGGISGGAVEAVADGYSGYLVDPDSVKEFCKAAEKLLSNDSLRKKIGEQGRKRAEKEMDWKTRAGVVLEIEGRK